MATQTITTTAERPMPSILDYDSAADWQAAWRAWDQERAVERQMRMRAARSNAARRGAATRERNRAARAA